MTLRASEAVYQASRHAPLGRGEAGAQDNVHQNQGVYRKHVEADVDAVERQDYAGAIEEEEEREGEEDEGDEEEDDEVVVVV